MTIRETGIEFAWRSLIQQGDEQVKADPGREGMERSGERTSGRGRGEGSQRRQLPQKGDAAPPDQEECTGDFTDLVAALVASEASIARENRYRDLPGDARPWVSPVAMRASKRRVQGGRVRVAVADADFPEIPLLPTERVMGSRALPLMPTHLGRGGAILGGHSSRGVGPEEQARPRGSTRLRLVGAALLLIASLALLVSQAVSERLFAGDVVSLPSR